jgi:hypothetical protein
MHLFDHARSGNLHLAFGPPRRRADVFDSLNDIHTLRNFTKHDMVAVEPGSDDGGDEELGTVRVGARVGHGEKAGAVVLQLKVLIYIREKKR